MERDPQLPVPVSLAYLLEMGAEAGALEAVRLVTEVLGIAETEVEAAEAVSLVTEGMGMTEVTAAEAMTAVIATPVKAVATDMGPVAAATDMGLVAAATDMGLVAAATERGRRKVKQFHKADRSAKAAKAKGSSLFLTN